MKHAILVLSSYGTEYLNNFLIQFKNDDRFDIFVHYDRKTKKDIKNKKEVLKANIKYLANKYKSKRFSAEMVKAMILLLSNANKVYDYDYYHFFSESCYLVKQRKSVDVFA